MDQHFVVDGPLDVLVKLGNGRLTVSRSENGTATVDVQPVDPGHEPSVRLAARADVRLDGDRLRVSFPEHGRSFRGGEVAVTLGLPASSGLGVKAGRATIQVRDGVESLNASLGSGEVDVDLVGDELTVKAGQADVVVRSAGSVAVAAGQGTLRADRVGDTAFKTGHGEVELGSTSGNVLVKGGAVQLVVHSAGLGEIYFDSGAGGARVAVVPGTTVQLHMTSGSGDVRCELPLESSAPTGGAGLRLRLRTGSGDLLVTSAAPASVG